MNPVNETNTVVVKVLDDYTIVINKGSNENVKVGQKYLIYSIDSEPLIDPITKENLGNLEIIKGVGVVTHVQDRISTLKSNKYSKPTKRVIKSKNPFINSWNQNTEEIVDEPEMLPFEDVYKGDYAKII